jgi:hypothetical protein
MVIIVTSVFYYANFTTFFKQLGLWSTPVRLITALLCAIGSGIFMWKKMGGAKPPTLHTHNTPRGGPPNSNNLFVSILVGGLKLGSIGFFIGFVGPIIFTPHSNQGPLLGILRRAHMASLLV